MDLYVSDQRPENWQCLSFSTHWEAWLNANIPNGLAAQVRTNLVSNLKHILVGLELKKALILPHANRAPGEREILFEPYCNTLVFEFNVGVYSVLEGLGSANWLAQNGHDGAGRRRVRRDAWTPVLCNVYDPGGAQGLTVAVTAVQTVRDKLHQDGVGARSNIDWHDLEFAPAFPPADAAIQTLLSVAAERVPEHTNLATTPLKPT